MRTLISKSFFIIALISLNTLAGNPFWPEETTLSLTAGYRQDCLDWNISGPNNKPNVLSELDWKNIRMAQIGIYGQAYFCDDFCFIGEADYAKIYKGRTQDSDYIKNNRRGKFPVLIVMPAEEKPLIFPELLVTESINMAI